MSAHGFDDSRGDPHLSRARDFLHDPHDERSGREPIYARSPLRMRLWLSLIGAVGFAALAVVFLIVQGSVWLPVVAIALAALGLVDAAVLTRRLQDRGD